MPTEQAALLKAMGEARQLAIQCGMAERYGTPLHRACDALRVAIDDLAEALTGDPTHFHAKPHGGEWMKPKA
jgi:hypothetical protein